jgi:hypothetical protein
MGSASHLNAGGLQTTGRSPVACGRLAVGWIRVDYQPLTANSILQSKSIADKTTMNPDKAIAGTQVIP